MSVTVIVKSVIVRKSVLEAMLVFVSSYSIIGSADIVFYLRSSLYI